MFFFPLPFDLAVEDASGPVSARPVDMIDHLDCLGPLREQKKRIIRDGDGNM